MSERRPHFVFTEPYDATAIARAEAVGRVSRLNACDESSLLEVIQDADALLIRTATRVTRRLLDRAPHLRVIGRGGSGLDHVDLDAARDRGIVVVHTPDAATDAVADLAVAMMLSLLRGVHECDRSVRSGRFEAARKANLGRELGTLTLGIVGMGRAGRAVARRCALGFGATIVFNDLVDVGPLEFPARSVSKRELYEVSDIVTLHVPLTHLTRHLIHAEVLERFRAGSFLINTARGAVIDAESVAQALRTGHLAGAGVDVFDAEPPSADHPLLTAPNTILTPHIGARTIGAQQRMNAVVEDVLRVLRGERPRHPAW